VNACSETVFKVNTAGGISNSIYMLGLTNVLFSIKQGSKVQMYDAFCNNDSIKTKDLEIGENSVLKIVANSRKDLIKEHIKC
jgi:hypothetical protein